MKTIRKAFKIYKCNISILLSLLAMILLSFIYSLVITILLLLIWPGLFLFGTIFLKDEKFKKWIDICVDSIQIIPENGND